MTPVRQTTEPFGSFNTGRSVTDIHQDRTHSTVGGWDLKKIRGVGSPLRLATSFFFRSHHKRFPSRRIFAMLYQGTLVESSLVESL